MHDALTRLGPPPFDDEDRKLAAQFQATMSPRGHRQRLPPRRPAGPQGHAAVRLSSCRSTRSGAPMMGSTDVGDVSWVVPTVQARGATYAIGTPGHSWQLTGQGKSPLAHKGMVHVAKVMASTASTR